MKEIIITLVCSILGSSALVSLITFLITRKDKKDDENDLLKQNLESMEKKHKEMRQDVTRIQLLILIANYPNETQRVLQTAQRYFEDLEGNWWMGSKFAEYCREHNIKLPDWFKEN